MQFSIGELLRNSAGRRLNRTALFDDLNSLTWEDAYSVSKSISNIIETTYTKSSLKTHGNCIAIYLDHSLLQALSIFGISISGNIFTVIHPSSSKEQFLHQVNDSGSNLVITDHKKRKNLQLDQHNFVILNYQLDEYLKNDLLDKFFSWLRTDTATLVYTSGSTGRAKGVIVPNSTLLDGVEIVNSYLKLDSKDRILSILPLNFDYGLNQILIATKTGASLYFHKYILPREMIKTISEFKITYFAVVPSIWKNIIKSALIARVDFSHVKKITTAGGPHSISLLQNIKDIFRKSKIYVMYGLTESFRTSYLNPKHLLKYENSIGKPVPGVKVLILRKDFTECDIDEIGTLFHTGAFINYGYLNSDKLTSEKFVYLRHPNNKNIRIKAVNSGDLVSRNKDGFIIYHGRDDSQLKISGFRISPSQIESPFLSLESINLCAATVLIIEGREHVVLLIECDKKLNEAKLKELRIWGKAYLPSYAVPSHIFQVSEIPKGKNFKVDYNQVLKIAYEKLS
jgi:acyl-CoA synthetase (AMP-forming)/AMP-acid ligase II